MYESALGFVLCVVAFLIYSKVDSSKYSKMMSMYELIKNQNNQQLKRISDLESDITSLRSVVVSNKAFADKTAGELPGICANITELTEKDTALEKVFRDYKSSFVSNLSEVQRKCERLFTRQTKLESQHFWLKERITPKVVEINFVDTKKDFKETLKKVSEQIKEF